MAVGVAFVVGAAAARPGRWTRIAEFGQRVCMHYERRDVHVKTGRGLSRAIDSDKCTLAPIWY